MLDRLRRRFVFELAVRYIEDSPDAWSRFRYDVPVVFVEGENRLDHPVDEGALEQLLREAGTPVAQ